MEYDLQNEERDMRVQKGFTLIELVVVMVVLGILAAFAIPKFYDFSTSAKTADINGLAGAFNSANVTAHGAALAQGQTAATGSISMEGSTVALVYGYPAATTGGIGNAVTISSQFTAQTPTATSIAYTYGTNLTCKVTYTQATSATVPATVAVDTSGC
jgi:MSHA pilin protein MshA